SLSGALVNQGDLAGGGGGKPRSVAVDPTGRFVYVANAGSSTVAAFAIDAATGKGIAVAGSPFATDTTPIQIIVDLQGKFAYVANQASSTVTVYSLDSSGALTQIDGSRIHTAVAPQSLAI